MPETIADGLQRIINAKTDLDNAIEAKGGTVTKGLENSDRDVESIETFIPTEEQLAAMNSGITAPDVAQIQTNTNDILNLNQNKIGASDYATQNTGGTVRVWTTTDGTDTILHISNEAPTP